MTSPTPSVFPFSPCFPFNNDSDAWKWYMYYSWCNSQKKGSNYLPSQDPDNQKALTTLKGAIQQLFKDIPEDVNNEMSVNTDIVTNLVDFINDNEDDIKKAHSTMTPTEFDAFFEKEVGAKKPTELSGPLKDVKSTVKVLAFAYLFTSYLIKKLNSDKKIDSSPLFAGVRDPKDPVDPGKLAKYYMKSSYDPSSHRKYYQH